MLTEVTIARWLFAAVALLTACFIWNLQTLTDNEDIND